MRAGKKQTSGSFWFNEEGLLILGRGELLPEPVRLDEPNGSGARGSMISSLRIDSVRVYRNAKILAGCCCSWLLLMSCSETSELEGQNCVKASLTSAIYSSRGARMRDHIYSSRRLRPTGRTSSTLFSATCRVEVKDSSDGAGRRESTTGLSEGCVARSEVRTERSAGFESEAGVKQEGQLRLYRIYIVI